MNTEQLIGYEPPMPSEDDRADCPECWRRMTYHPVLGDYASDLYRCEPCNVTALGLDVWRHL